MASQATLDIIDQMATALGDPETPIANIVEMVERDDLLARRIVRLANSAFFAGRSRVCTVRDAVVRVGTANLADALFDSAA
jgi:HD-like signal output (HDOD) protein